MISAAPSPVTVTWFQLMFALIGGGTLAAVINGLFKRRELGASATKIITEAAASLTTQMQRRIEELEAEEQAHDIEWRKFKDLLRAHEAWDRQFVKKMRQLNPDETIPDPPPLYLED